MTSDVNPISTADEELLSAYLDDRLDPESRAAIERRLASEPVLRAALADLRATVAALHALGALTPPRSFTLDRQHARRGGLLFGVLRLSTALSALVLMLSLTPALMGGQFARTSAPVPAAAPAAEQRQQPTHAGGAGVADVQTGTPEPTPEVGALAMPETMVMTSAATPAPQLEFSSVDTPAATDGRMATMAPSEALSPAAAGVPAAPADAPPAGMGPPAPALPAVLIPVTLAIVTLVLLLATLWAWRTGR